jgi:hypothetical protein
MSEQGPTEELQARLTKRASSFRRRVPRKLAELLPFKTQIKELRARNAAYDDIRLILAEEKIEVNVDRIFRFCRDVLREKSGRPRRSRAPKVSPSAVQPAQPSPAAIQATLQEQRERRERFPGLFARPKRGPRIADSKSL